MHKWIWGAIGVIIWCLLWPVWIIYFRYGPMRSRVLVVCGNEILVVQNWLGLRKYSLPGGGCHKHENTQASAVRELHEETGILSSESALVKLGSRRHKKYGITYHAKIFCLELDEKPAIKARYPEILTAEWIPIDAADSAKFESEVIYAAKRYRPLRQASLL